jgi:hypothetical protein
MNYHTITKKQRTLDLVFVCLHGAALLNHPPRKKGVPATDFISAERKFTEVCAFARPLAELVTPPTMRHHAETSSTMIADLRLPHPIEAVRVGSLQAAVERAASHATSCAVELLRQRAEALQACVARASRLSRAGAARRRRSVLLREIGGGKISPSRRGCDCPRSGSLCFL